MPQPLRVLIVEDPAADAAGVVGALRAAGYEVVPRRVGSADELAAALAEGGWDVVLGGAADAVPVPAAPVVAAAETGACAHPREADRCCRAASPAADRRPAGVGEGFNQAVLDSLASHVAVLDPDGVIVAVNAAWGRFAAENGAGPGFGVGGDYLAVCLRATGEWADEASAAAAGIRGVLAGVWSSFELEYACHPPDGGERWFLMSVTPLAPGPRGAVVAHTDITARKLAEESRARLAAVVEGSNDAILSTTLDGVITGWNPAAERLYGWTAAEVTGRHVSVIIPPDKAGELADILARVPRGERVELFETVRVRRDGRAVDVAITISPVRDPAGRVIGVSSVSRDVTDRKRAEESLARDAMILANVRDAVVVTDLDGVVTYWNEGATRLFGWTAEEMVGRPYADRFPEPERARVAEEIRKRAAGEDWSGEFEDWRKDGSRVWIDSRVTRIADPSGRAVGLIGVSHDITARKQAEEELRQSEARLARAQRTAGLGSWELDLVTGRLTWSDEVYRLFGLRPGELTPTREGFRALVHPDDRPRVAAAVRATLEGGEPHDYDHRVLLPGGGERVVNERAELIRDGSGRPVQLLGTVLDVTDRRRAEAELRRSESFLRLVWDSAADGMRLTDAAGAVAMANPAYCRLVGRPAAEVVGHPLADAYAPARRETILAEYRERFAARAVLPQYEAEVELWDGRQRWFEVANAFLDTPGESPLLLGVFRDVTDRKRTEEALRESEERFRRVFEDAPIGIYRTTPDGRVLLANPAAVRMAGHRSFEELAGRNLEAGGLNADYARDEFKRRLERDGEVRGLEVRWRKAGGEMVYVRENARAVRGPGGSVAYYEGTLEDVTDRKRAEDALREREEFLRALVDHIPCGVFWKDRDSVYLGCNEQVARDWGYGSPDRLVGRSDADVVLDPAEAAFSRECDQRVIGTGEPLINIEETQTRPDGTRAVLLTSKVPLRDSSGAVVGVLGVYLDVTERKRAEEALRASERHLRAVIDTSPECVKLIDPNGRLVEMNPSGLAMLEIDDPAAVVGARVWDIVVPEDRDAFRRLHEEVCGGRAGILEFSIVGLRGTRRRVETHAVPLPGPDGRLLHLGLTRDITERKRLEERLQQSQKMEAIGQLAGGVAHDFNNLLTIINGYSDVLLDTLPKTDPNRPLVEEVRAAGERSAGLTRQLLAFSRRQVVAPKVLDPNAVVRDAENMLRRMIGEDVRLVTDLDPALGRVRIDRGQLEQVVMNLVVNARDAMPRGGTLTIATANAGPGSDEAGRAKGGGPCVVLSVSDTGVGMNGEVKRHLFEPFFTTKGPGRGTGLGLAVVHGVVSQAGGYVGVESEPGRGTTFRVYLPRVEEPAAAGKAPPRLSDAPQGTETVLLVEDEDAVRALARHVLRGCGYTVLEAADGADALRVSDEYPGLIEMLVTDVVMPGMGGRELADQLVARRPGVRVLFLSGYTSDAVVRHGVREDGLNFLEKPYSPDALARKVRDILDRAR